MSKLTTEDSAAPKASGIGCAFKTLGMLCLLLLFCAGAGGTIIWVKQLEGKKQLTAAVARVQNAKEPLDGSDLSAVYRALKGRVDVTARLERVLATFDSSLYVQACADLPIVGTGAEKKIPRAGEPWPDEQRVDAFLKNYQAEIAELHALAEIDGEVHHAYDFTKGFALLLPDIQRSRNAARVLDLLFRRQMYREEWSEALMTLHTQLRLCESLRDEPLLISQLVRDAIFGIANNEAHLYLEQANFTDEDLTQLQTWIAELEFEQAQRKALQGERAMSYHTLALMNPQEAMLLDGNQSGEWLLSGLGEGGLARLRPGDTAMLLDTMTELVEAAKLPFPQSLQKQKAIETALAQAIAADKDALPWDRNFLAQMLLPSVGGVINATGRAITFQRSTLAAIAVERYRLKHGALPNGLDELVPEFLAELPEDPMNGLPLLFKVEDGAYSIYGLGANGADDGGAVGEDKQLADWGIRVERKD